jgi:uncharacterized protein YecT (DUF1311 family)
VIAASALLMLAQAGASAAESAIDCDNAQTQTEMNICAAREFAASDAELNAQWEKTAAAMKALDAELDRETDKQLGHYDTLLEGQRAWLTFRDAQCLAESFKARGGSMQPLLVAQCKTYMTELRTEQLRDLAAGPE